MADIKTPEQRSKNMSKIRSKGTKPEEYIRKKLFALGYRYRKNVSSLIGHPDAWFPKYNTALFVNGCFWHRHKNCKYAYTPKSRVEFWTNKFRHNIERDQVVKQQLLQQGIKVLFIWECTIKQMKTNNDYEDSVLTLINQFLNSNQPHMEL